MFLSVDPFDFSLNDNLQNRFLENIISDEKVTPFNALRDARQDDQTPYMFGSYPGVLYDLLAKLYIYH